MKRFNVIVFAISVCSSAYAVSDDSTPTYELSVLARGSDGKPHGLGYKSSILRDDSLFVTIKSPDPKSSKGKRVTSNFTELPNEMLAFPNITALPADFWIRQSRLLQARGNKARQMNQTNRTLADKAEDSQWLKQIFDAQESLRKNSAALQLAKSPNASTTAIAGLAQVPIIRVTLWRNGLVTPVTVGSLASGIENLKADLAASQSQYNSATFIVSDVRDFVDKVSSLNRSTLLNDLKVALNTDKDVQPLSDQVQKVIQDATTLGSALDKILKSSPRSIEQLVATDFQGEYLLVGTLRDDVTQLQMQIKKLNLDAALKDLDLFDTIEKALGLETILDDLSPLEGFIDPGYSQADAYDVSIPVDASVAVLGPDAKATPGVKQETLHNEDKIVVQLIEGKKLIQQETFFAFSDHPYSNLYPIAFSATPQGQKHVDYSPGAGLAIALGYGGRGDYDYKLAINPLLGVGLLSSSGGTSSYTVLAGVGLAANHFVAGLAFNPTTQRQYYFAGFNFNLSGLGHLGN